MRGDRILVVLMVLGAVACGRAPSEQNSESAPNAAHLAHGMEHGVAMSEGPELYEATGTVLFFEHERIYLNHEEMLGFMDAMAMGYDVRDPALLENILPGADVQFRVVVEGDTFYIDQLFPVE